MSRSLVLDELAARIVRIDCPHPVRVAIDGIDTAGKSTLADELGDMLTARDRDFIHASIDGFHRPRAERYAQGDLSPAGYYDDSFDLRRVTRDLLVPLGPNGDRRYCTAAFDWRTKRRVAMDPSLAPDNAILLFDGVFTLRPELRDHWDFTVFVDVTFDVAYQRAAARDAGATRERYEARHFAAQRIYLSRHDPRNRADAVIDNYDVGVPRLLVLPET